VDEHSIERIRNANFSHSVRGYDRPEVDRFLAELADWLETGGGEHAASLEAVRTELERVGEHTAGILTEAHAAADAIRADAAAQVRQQLVDVNATAESLRAEAGEYAGDTRDEADAYARKVRSEADTYADQTRSEADAEIEEERASATKEAERLVGDANRRKAEVEKVISDLEQRRDAVIAELDRLASGIAGTATEHRPSGATEGNTDESDWEATEGEGEGPIEDESTEERAIDDTQETTVLSRESE
jgi:DivIVA domain-containing protein